MTTTTTTTTVTVTIPGSIASPWVLQSVPEPGSPFPPSTKFIVVGAIVIKISSEKPVSKIFLVSELHLLFCCQDVAVLLILANLKIIMRIVIMNALAIQSFDLNLRKVFESTASFHDQLVNDPVLEVLLQHEGAAILGHVELPVPFKDVR